MDRFESYASTIYARCEVLAEFSQDPVGINRQYLTTQHQAANKQVAEWMSLAGMTSWQDEAGNLWGAYKSDVPDAKTLLIGSHLDTVPNSGKYDGILGVLLPISLIHYYHNNGVRFPFNIEVIGFGDEEGTRFGTTLLGSRAIAGTWQDKWAALMDKEQICLAQAMRNYGLDINNIHKAARNGNDIIGFVEVHIEQGPVLEANDLALGAVTGIAGACRFNIHVTGSAGHAGTVPMNMRQDALCASAEMILAIERIALETDVVATVGKIQARPNAVNVICGKSEFSLDVRSQDDAQRDKAILQMRKALSDVAVKRNLDINIKQTHRAQAVACDGTLTNTLLSAIERANLPTFTLPSGAGHDAMAMADLCPVSMLFMRCDRGISHHPAEAINVTDVSKTLNVMKHFLHLMAEQYQ